MSNPDQRPDAEYDKIELTEFNHFEVREFADAIGLAKLNDRSIILYCGNRRITMSPGDYLFKDRDGKLVTVNPA